MNVALNNTKISNQEHSLSKTFNRKVNLTQCHNFNSTSWIKVMDRH